MVSPREVIISITNRCNLRCRMCHIPENKNGELATFQWKQVIKDAASCGSHAIVFSGGEPLLREDIFELISFTKNHSMGACLTSNGSLVKDGVAEKLKQYGVDVVNISIEGPRRIHDYLRGKGMFERTIGALENLRKHKIEATIATMVSRYNYKYLPYILELASRHGVTTVKFQPFSRIFLNNRQGGESFFILRNEIKKITQIIHSVINLSNDYAIATNPSGYLKMIPFYLSGKYINLNKGCAALEGSCPINCNGDIFPCWALSDEDTLVGNIKDSSFANIWDSPRHKAIIEKIKNDGCSGCLMSCYDANFGKEPFERRIVMNMKRLQKKGIDSYARGILKRWSRRIKFYGSYRGSFKGIVNRFHGLLHKKRKFEFKLNHEETVDVLKEIEAAKQILEEELRRSK